MHDRSSETLRWPSVAAGTSKDQQTSLTQYFYPYKIRKQLP